MRRDLAAAAAALARLGGGDGPPARPGVFVLGVDGMDPVILQRLIDAGRLPHFQALAGEGGFQALGTSNPPQSPVAWSNFVTGMDPGGHGIFDFLHRDAKTYLPTSSATPPPEDPPPYFAVGDYFIPLGGGDLINNRTGQPWWDALHAAGVTTEVYRIPGNYPPTPSEARTLSGMGTVDMRGGYGVYTWFTDQPLPPGDKKGDIQLVTVEDYDLDGAGDTVRGTLKGAPDIFRLPPGQIPGDADYLTAPVRFSLDPAEDVVLVEVGDARAVLREGEWSPWLPVSFDALPAGLLPLGGAVRFYAKQLRPTFQVYASPVNMASDAPPQAITTPDDFSGEVHDAMGGQFYTQGMPEETNALKDGTFDDDDYESQVHRVMEDAERMLEVALDRFSPGDATFFYLSDIDLQCHMLWRHGDPKTPGAPPHPAYDAASAAHHADDIEHYYENVDRLLGEIRAGLPAGSLLLVMSDHGFQPFTRKVHLNAWLRDNGYLVLKGGKTTGHIAHGDVDWSRTRAYAIGFNGLYLNRAGREGEGIVTDAEAGPLMDELAARLLALTDGPAATNAVLLVDRSTAVYSGPRVAEAPDLVIGFNAGFGHSDESTLGEVPAVVVEDNTSRWSGNHLMAPEVVPGVLLANRPIDGSGHEITDVTATLYAWFGLTPPAGSTGQPVLRP